MMRALWTAASGMISQQQNVDLITNNLANVNTYGYKKERMEFKTLLYQTLERASYDPANQERLGKPVNLQIGLGVKPIASAKIFSAGNLQRTDYPLDIAIEGEGFFAVRQSENEILYTRDGSFKVSVVDEGLMLVTSQGYPVLNTDDDVIVFPTGVNTSTVMIDDAGNISYMSSATAIEDMGMQINIVQFPNKQGLESVGGNFFVVSPASGEPMPESEGVVTRPSRLVQNVLEMSNVQIAEEMVNLIIAQRAYDLNSRAIQTSDDMLQSANTLKR